MEPTLYIGGEKDGERIYTPNNLGNVKTSEGECYRREILTNNQSVFVEFGLSAEQALSLLLQNYRPAK